MDDSKIGFFRGKHYSFVRNSEGEYIGMSEVTKDHSHYMDPEYMNEYFCMEPDELPNNVNVLDII